MHTSEPRRGGPRGALQPGPPVCHAPRSGGSAGHCGPARGAGRASGTNSRAPRGRWEPPRRRPRARPPERCGPGSPRGPAGARGTRPRQPRCRRCPRGDSATGQRGPLDQSLGQRPQLGSARPTGRPARRPGPAGRSRRPAAAASRPSPRSRAPPPSAAVTVLRCGRQPVLAALSRHRRAVARRAAWRRRRRRKPTTSWWSASVRGPGPGTDSSGLTRIDEIIHAAGNDGGAGDAGRRRAPARRAGDRRSHRGSGSRGRRRPVGGSRHRGSWARGGRDDSRTSRRSVARSVPAAPGSRQEPEPRVP